MVKKQAIQLFQQQKVRTIWDDETEEWYFSVVDVCNVLAGSTAKDPGAYWRKLKQRLKKEGSEVVTHCHGLRMLSSDGKYYKTEASATELSKQENPSGYKAQTKVAKRGGSVAKAARTQLEDQLGHTVVTSLNAQDNVRRLDENNAE